jgi:hypothetical protein
MEFQNCKGYLIALMLFHLNVINNEKDGIERFHNPFSVFFRGDNRCS